METIMKKISISLITLALAGSLAAGPENQPAPAPAKVPKPAQANPWVSLNAPVREVTVRVDDRDRLEELRSRDAATAEYYRREAARETEQIRHEQEQLQRQM